jgi:hypothetical protein
MNCSVCEGVGLVTREDVPRPWRLPKTQTTEADRTLACIVLGNPPYVGVPLVGARPCTAHCEATKGMLYFDAPRDERLY